MKEGLVDQAQAGAGMLFSQCRKLLQLLRTPGRSRGGVSTGMEPWGANGSMKAKWKDLVGCRMQCPPGHPQCCQCSVPVICMSHIILGFLL